MTLDEVAEQGIVRVRRPDWADPTAYLLLKLRGTTWDRYGELHSHAVYDRFCIACPRSIDLLATGSTWQENTDYTPYTGQPCPAENKEEDE